MEVSKKLKAVRFRSVEWSKSHTRGAHTPHSRTHSPNWGWGFAQFVNLFSRLRSGANNTCRLTYFRLIPRQLCIIEKVKCVHWTSQRQPSLATSRQRCCGRRSEVPHLNFENDENKKLSQYKMIIKIKEKLKRITDLCVPNGRLGLTQMPL